MSANYKIMPLNYAYWKGKVLITGISGEYIILEKDHFHDFINHELANDCETYQNLKSKNLLSDSNTELVRSVDMTATKLRAKKAFLNDFTSLHMMVITVRCNQKCTYCQVSCEDEDSKQYDMDIDTARRIVDFIFQSPSHNIKIEFQGGEPILNWEVIEHTILYAEKKNETYKKNLEIVLCTNITANIETKAVFLKEHSVSISTSLDGNKDVHDHCRLRRNGSGTYNKFISNLKLLRETYEHDTIGALMTTTSYSLDKIKEIIDEYVKNDFDGIFLRAINPYGFASENEEKLSYSIDKFVTMYKEALEYIININKEGHFFPEHYTALLLRRILTPYATGFVDLQSPSGAGISGVIYDYNGDVYPADEGRMLARMGDKYFCMGNVKEHSYEEVFSSKLLKNIVSNSCLDIMPHCYSCVFSPYCGADPIRNYLEKQDIMGYRLDSAFCDKNKAIFSYLFELIQEDDEEIMDILWSWITNKPLKKTSDEAHR